MQTWAADYDQAHASWCQKYHWIPDKLLIFILLLFPLYFSSVKLHKLYGKSLKNIHAVGCLAIATVPFWILLILLHLKLVIDEEYFFGLAIKLQMKHPYQILIIINLRKLWVLDGLKSKKLVLQALRKESSQNYLVNFLIDILQGW